MKSVHRTLLVDLLSLPTSPFNEQFVVRYIRRWVAGRPSLKLSQDRFGNLQITLRRDGGRRGTTADAPLVLAAHMDHPGFEAERMIRPGLLRAIWRGGVATEYFDNARVRFWVESGGATSKTDKGGHWVRGVIDKVRLGEQSGRRRVTSVDVSVRRDVTPGSVGMWDFPDPVVRGSRLYARGCDDVAGVAAVLAALDVLAGRSEPVHVIAMLNRAEEVGFAGAMAACAERNVPEDALMISVECSSELAGGKMGEGPILRVGDLSSVFTPEISDFCRRVAGGLQSGRRPFRFQRKLMDGGTCEASAFLDYGYRTSGLCIALGNYHNMDRRRGRIGAEFVDLGDWDALVEWFVALSIAARLFDGGHPELSRRLERLYQEWTPLLEATAGRVG